MPPSRMPLLGSSWRDNINTHGLPQPSPGSRHSWPLVLSYLWLFLAFNFAAGTRLYPQEDPASQADSSQRGRKMSKLSKPSARVPGSDAGHLMGRCTRAWLLGGNVLTTEKPVSRTRCLSCAPPSSPPLRASASFVTAARGSALLLWAPPVGPAFCPGAGLTRAQGIPRAAPAKEDCVTTIHLASVRDSQTVLITELPGVAKP